MKPLLRLLYTLAVYLATPVILMYLAWRGVRHRAYWQRWRERLGFLRQQPLPGGVWVHAVSVGEVNGVLPLVRQLQQAYPERCIIFTCATPTGSQRICDVFNPTMLGTAPSAEKSAAKRSDNDQIAEPERGQVYHCYLPLDLPAAQRRLFAQLQPTLLVVMEAEIWPNLFFAAQRHQVPTVVVNARLSQRSADGYRRYLPQARMALESAAAIVAQTEADARRFVNAGAHPEAVSCSGNLKGDVRLPDDVCQRAYALQKQWGGERCVWMGASTHEGEEAALLAAHRQLLATNPNALLMIVPRHPERFERAVALSLQAGFQVACHSDLKQLSANTQVLVVDAMGVLVEYAAAAQLIFVGGSLVPIGGHNPLEPAALGKAVIMGACHDNARDLIRLLCEAEAACVVNNAAELSEIVVALCGQPERLQSMGQQALAVAMAQRGAVARTCAVIERYLD
jgi:3-deoxy-D-manno-octulosonic-acid transferase